MAIPRELLRSRPRGLRITPAGMAYIATVLLTVSLTAYYLLTEKALSNYAIYRVIWLVPLAIGRMFLKFRKQAGLLANGRPTESRVVSDVTPWWMRGKGNRTRRMSCTYSLPSGASATGTVDVGWKAPSPGAQVVIIYDPDEPAKAILYPPKLLAIKR